MKPTPDDIRSMVKKNPTLGYLSITVSKTSDGSFYVQIFSADQSRLNIVLIADEVDLQDKR